MASKIRLATVLVCTAAILGSGAYCVDWYLAQREARSQSLPSDAGGDSRYARYRRPTEIKTDPNGFAPMDVVEPQKPITEFEVISEQKADDWLDDDELVIGVVVENVPRAYVINTMTGPQREIFNDTLAGRPIAATW